MKNKAIEVLNSLCYKDINVIMGAANGLLEVFDDDKNKSLINKEQQEVFETLVDGYGEMNVYAAVIMKMMEK
jgi:hypothetical protein